MELLRILEDAVAEIRELQRRVEGLDMMRKLQTLHIAMSQMRGNVIEHEDADDAEWKAVDALIQAGRIGMSHTGEVLMDRRMLTKELLHAEMTKTVTNDENRQT